MITLHSTIVVGAFADGSFMLNSGGYRTVTTKERLNRFSPVIVHQKKGEWLVDMPEKTVEFSDRMWINAEDLFPGL